MTQKKLYLVDCETLLQIAGTKAVFATEFHIICNTYTATATATATATTTTTTVVSNYSKLNHKAFGFMAKVF